MRLFEALRICNMYLINDEAYICLIVLFFQLLNPKPVKLQKYGWSDCSGGKGSAFVKNLLIGPDPVYVPGPLDVTAAINISHECITPLKVNIEDIYFFGVNTKYISSSAVKKNQYFFTSVQHE